MQQNKTIIQQNNNNNKTKHNKKQMQIPMSPLITSEKGTTIEGIIKEGSRLREGHDIVDEMSPNNRK